MRCFPYGFPLILLCIFVFSGVAHGQHDPIERVGGAVALIDSKPYPTNTSDPGHKLATVTIAKHSEKRLFILSLQPADGNSRSEIELQRPGHSNKYDAWAEIIIQKKYGNNYASIARFLWQNRADMANQHMHYEIPVSSFTTYDILEEQQNTEYRVMMKVGNACNVVIGNLRLVAIPVALPRPTPHGN